jgi:hypothetical protein
VPQRHLFRVALDTRPRTARLGRNFVVESMRVGSRKRSVEIPGGRRKNRHVRIEHEAVGHREALTSECAR